MTCKDCIHYNLCRSISRIQLGWRGNSVHYVENVEEICKDFKACAQFVELPFDVGDSYFEILATIDDKTAAIFEFHIDRIIQLKNAYGEPTEIFYEDRKAGRFQNALKPYNRRFRSREEAEQALKESEENAN